MEDISYAHNIKAMPPDFGKLTGIMRGALGIQSVSPWGGLLRSFGGDFFDASGKIAINSPQSVQAAQYWPDQTRTRAASRWQTAAVMATPGLSSGALVQLEAAWSLPETSPTELDARFRLIGTAAALFIDSSENGIRVATSDRFDVPMPAAASTYGRAQGPLHDELASFVQCCVHGSLLPVPMREAAQAVLVVDALSTAVRQDKTVPVVQL